MISARTIQELHTFFDENLDPKSDAIYPDEFAPYAGIRTACSPFRVDYIVVVTQGGSKTRDPGLWAGIPLGLTRDAGLVQKPKAATKR